MNQRILTALFLLLAVAACNVTDGDVPVEIATTLELGAEMQLAVQSIGAGGGSLVVPTSADTLGGITITVPPGAYAEPRTFTVSYAPITAIRNGGDYTLLSPAIFVDNGGDYADDMMTMKIPVTVPSDMFAMAFAYDENGGFEAIPILDQDPGSVTLWSMHFEHSAIHDPFVGKRSAVQGSAAGKRRSLLVIIARHKEKVMNGNVPTTFKPGTDDWSFRNLGSTIAPGGHCAGQSWGMMYYFIDHRKKGEPQLNGRFDNDGSFATPKVWQDDASAYRYCSALQSNYNTFVKVGFNLDKQLQALGKTNAFLDSLTFMAFKLGMYVSKAPQFITVWTRNSDAGHAMVIYGATATELNICDPNYPGNIAKGNPRSVRFSGGGFQAYHSGADADQADQGETAYPVIWFYGTSSAINWTAAKREWSNVPNRAGGVAYFPSYVIKVRDSEAKEFEPLTSGWKSTTGKLQTQVTSSASPLSVQGIFQVDGTATLPDADWYTIPDGRNQLGFYLRDAGAAKPKWAGFRWVEVVGKDAPPIPRCTRDKTWETTLGAAHIVYTDSSAKGRRVVFEDLSEPEDICSDVHIHPQWEVKGNLSGLKIVASAYWSLFGEEVDMTMAGSKATATMEIGLKQAFDDDPGYVGLQTEVFFPSRGSLAADLAWLASKNLVTRITLTYKEHAR